MAGAGRTSCRLSKACLVAGLFVLIGAGPFPFLHPAAASVRTTAHTHAVREDTMETLHVAGLEAPVEILTDRWGIAHIYAENQHDLFFAQGYNAARDRLFQLEIWRRRVLGRLAEIQGPKALARDVGARLLSFRGDLDREYAYYHPDGKAIVAAFVDGINASIQHALDAPDTLPVEFRLLGVVPEPWTPEVVVARIGGIFLNLETEVLIAKALRSMSPDTIRMLLHLHPGRPELQVADGVALDAIPDDVLRYYLATREAVEFAPEDIVNPADRAADTQPADVIGARGSRDEGSNNWVVGGAKTLSRQPLLANDPHRAITAPSLRYWVHLVAPGWDVIGGGEPHLPGVSIGHNRHGAWGLTIFPTDAEDLYVYRTNPDDPNQYWYADGWEDMRIVRETIPVKGEADAVVELKYTRHGPILAEDRAGQRAYALRAAWLDVGGAPYLASLRMDQATTWEEFRAACASARAPSENMIWADTAGNIGWQAVGVVPRRPNWNGLVPVPGDGRFEWDGYIPIRDLPHSLNPSEGFIATANQENLPPGYPEPISFYWLEPYRHARIVEVLADGRRLTARDMLRLQNDEYSIPARELVPLLNGLDLADSADAPVRAAAERLRNWDFVLDTGSVGAGIYAAWQRRLWAAFVELHAPESLHASFLDVIAAPMIQSLLAPDGSFGADPLAGRDRFVRETFTAAVRDLVARLGPNPDTWTYGQTAYHHIAIRHMLGKAVNPGLRDRLEVGPFPRGGDSFTVNNTGTEDEQTVGASFRFVADPSDWDRCLGVNTPGQSGDPANPHYRDLARLWADGEYFPVLYSREKIAAVTERKTVLQPASP